jgi:RNA polymerase sigma factor (sigma-70 family)
VNYTNLSDEALILLMARAQPQALQELYERYNRLVFSLALGLVGDRALAEEITLDVFTKIWEKVETYRPDRANVRSWITTITRNQAIDMLRRWPAPLQVLSQLVIALLVGGAWGGLFFGFLRLTGEAPVQISPSPEAQTVAGAPIASPVPTLAPPIDTPTATATHSPAAETETAPSDPPQPDDPPAPPTLLPTATVAVPLSPTSEPPRAEEGSAVSFAGDVYPILENRCVKCHGGEKTEEGLVMTSYADLLKGSWNGPVLEPGDAENSFLVEQIVSGEMPKNDPRLLPAEIRVIRAWIEAGALDN